MNMSNLIKQKRQEKNLRMEDLASLIGVSVGTVSRWESGNIQKIRNDKILLLCKYLDIPIDLILSEESMEDYKNGIIKIKDSINYLQKNNNSFTNCNFNNKNFNNNNIQEIKNQTKLQDLMNNLSNEEQEKVLEYAEFLVNKQKK